MDVADARSSSNDLSSAPNSDIEPPNFHSATPSRPSTASAPHHPGSNYQIPVGSGPISSSGIINRYAPASATSTLNRQATPPVKQRKPRKKKDPSTSEAEKKEKVPRKPRAPYGTAGTSRKKPKVENIENSNIHQFLSPASDLNSSKLVEPVHFSPQPQQDTRLDEAAKTSQNGFLNHTSPMRPQTSDQPQYVASPIPPQQASTPRSSAMYDPIRSVTIQRPAEPAPSSYLPHYNHNQTPPRPPLNASASPAISSIIDPPMQTQQPMPTTTRAYNDARQPDSFSNKAHESMSTKPTITTELDLSISDQPEQKRQSISKKITSEAPTRTASPKPTRAKEQPPPLPPGSGLLSASLFGGESSMDANQPATEKGPTIVLHVDLQDPNNKVINFARMAEEKYGFAALYPRQAAQRERLAKVAAAGAALERSASGSKFGGTSAGESGDDDVSVDIDRDSDNDGDVTMSGVNGAQEPANSGTDGPGPKRRRRRKVEEYDQDDPFVDDSEMIWEAQAAASKDGFFVYCGPLVPEGEKPAVERADGTVKRGRGRGRGGGPGSRGGRGGANAEGGIGRGGGPGSRGGGVTRKPRMTKAERLQREQEKQAREKMAVLAAKPMGYPS